MPTVNIKSNIINIIYLYTKISRTTVTHANQCETFGYHSQQTGTVIIYTYTGSCRVVTPLHSRDFAVPRYKWHL